MLSNMPGVVQITFTQRGYRMSRMSADRIPVKLMSFTCGRSWKDIDLSL